MSFPSSHSCTRRRNPSPGLYMSLRYSRGWCYSHRCLPKTFQVEFIMCGSSQMHHQPVYKMQLRSCGFVFRPQDKPCDLLISQWSPSQPSAQMHWYTLTLSMQVPPLWHGLLSQSLMSETEDGEHDLGVADPSPRAVCAESELTLVTVSASEALLTLAGELSPSLAPAAAVRSTHV